MPLRADVDEEALYLIPENDNQYDKPDAHKLVENRAGETHVKYLRSDHPESKNTSTP